VGEGELEAVAGATEGIAARYIVGCFLYWLPLL
jgi:hypothetical protein